MLRFALKSMATRKAKLVMTALSVIITASVALMAYNISTQVSEGIVNTAAKYDMIIGPSGSATQLAMNTMFFTDKPLGTIPYSVVEDLQNSGLVNQAIPFSMGDSYNAAPIVGTDAALLADKPLKSGAMFAQAMEAVVGYDVARQYNLAPGDSIVTSHGLGGSGEAHAASPLLITGVASAEFNPITAEQKASAEEIFAGKEIYWSSFGHKYHVDSECQAIRNSSSYEKGEVTEAIEKGRGSLCAFCARDLVKAAAAVLDPDNATADQLQLLEHFKEHGYSADDLTAIAQNLEKLKTDGEVVNEVAEKGLEIVVPGASVVTTE